MNGDAPSIVIVGAPAYGSREASWDSPVHARSTEPLAQRAIPDHRKPRWS